jgi:hypothetical protein
MPADAMLMFRLSFALGFVITKLCKDGSVDSSKVSNN